MASVGDKPVVASGIDTGDAARKRNVVANQAAAAVPPVVEIDDKKKTAKKVCIRPLACSLSPQNNSSIGLTPLSCSMLILGLPLGPLHARRFLPVGVDHCPHCLYGVCFLHTVLEDWSLANCDLG